MSKRTALFWLLLIVIVGIGIRSWHLTGRSLWFDEAFSWRLIKFPVAEMIARAATDVHPPLYYLLLKSWSSIFGTSLLAMRSLSVVLAGTTIAAGYLFTAAALRSRTTGLLAAALLALSGFQIQYAWEARMYTLGTTLALLSSWLLLQAIRTTLARSSATSRMSLWAAYALITAAFAYVHYYAFFTIAAQAVYVVGFLITHTRGRIGEIVQLPLTRYGLAAALLAIVIFSPWIPTFLSQNAQVQDNYWIPSIGGWSIPDTFYRMFAPTSGIPTHTGLGWIILAATPIALTFLGWLFLLIAAHRTPARDGIWVIVISGIIPFIISIILSFLGQSLYQDRFFVFAHLFIIIGLAALISYIRPPIVRRSIIVLALAGFLVAHLSFWQELDILNKPGARAATSYAIANQQAGEPILVSSPFIYFAVLHYSQEDYKQSTQPKLYTESGQLSHFAGGPILTTNDIVGPSIFADNQALWLIDTSGFGGSKLTPPGSWQAAEEQAYPEIFSHQGEVFVTKYIKD